MMPPLTSKSKQEFNQRFQEIMDAIPTVTKCLFCQKFFSGTALEGREWAFQHRADEHPEKQKRRRQNRSLNRFNPANMTMEQEEEMIAARHRRMRLLGISPNAE